MENLTQLIDIGQAGATVVLLLVLWQLWQEQKTQNAFIRQMLVEARKDREAIKQAVGAESKSV